MNSSSKMHAGAAGRHQNGSSSANAQRWGALIGGGALAVFGATRRSKSGIALAATGGLLAYMGSKSAMRNRDLATHTSVLLNCSPEQAYEYWRNFENLPKFMRHLASVNVEEGGRKSHWVAVGPGGTRVEWDAEITSEQPNQSIAWRSLPGSSLETSGRVQFKQAPGNRGTMMAVRIAYQPPAGLAGLTVAKALGKDPHFLIKQDLRRFKSLIETGEIPTIEGQSHGPRSAAVALFRTVDPDRPVERPSAIGEKLVNSRRAS